MNAVDYSSFDAFSTLIISAWNRDVIVEGFHTMAIIKENDGYHVYNSYGIAPDAYASLEQAIDTYLTQVISPGLISIIGIKERTS